MRRNLILKHPHFEIEQGPAEYVRIYRVPGLYLYDEQEEKNHRPVIDLVRSLPGVARGGLQGLSYICCQAISARDLAGCRTQHRGSASGSGCVQRRFHGRTARRGCDAYSPKSYASATK